MKKVRGTAGYSKVIERFVQATAEVDFDTLHQPYRHLIPEKPSRILDIGAGAGRDAGVFAAMGHQVVAVEPMPEFLAAAMQNHDALNITWIDDSLPILASLGKTPATFGFVLVSAVWHHIDDSERDESMARIAQLTHPGAVLAMSLRNGPAGAGTHTFPTHHEQTIRLAMQHGFESAVTQTGQPSLLSGKSDVTWSKLAFIRR